MRIKATVEVPEGTLCGGCRYVREFCDDARFDERCDLFNYVLCAEVIGDYEDVRIEKCPACLNAERMGEDDANKN